MSRHRLGDAQQQLGWYSYMCRDRTLARMWVGAVTFRLPSVLPTFCTGTGFRDCDVDIARFLNPRDLLMEH